MKKQIENKFHKEKKFLKLPKYPGGAAAFKKFIDENIKYPKQAIDNNIKGEVFVEFEVDDNGNVLNPKIIKGIGYGCDEETLRLVSLLKYEKTKNIGVRIKSNIKTKIRFDIKKTTMHLNYNIKQSENNIKKQNIYTYQIKIY